MYTVADGQTSSPVASIRARKRSSDINRGGICMDRGFTAARPRAIKDAARPGKMSASEEAVVAAPEKYASEKNSGTNDMSNVLAHIQGLEKTNSALSAKLKTSEERNGKLSAKTREGMQSALDSLMKKWMDAVETKDDKVKDQFKDGLSKLVTNSAEDNGVWQMMVAASSLHERQEHNLDTLRQENTDLKLKVDGIYADSSARVVGQKSRAEHELCRDDVEPSPSAMWDDFAKDIGSMY